MSAPKEIPMLFSPVMSLATVKGIKTQTRRMDGLHEVNEAPDRWKIFERNKLGQYILTANDARPDNYVYLTPRYNVGDIIWGKEAWRADKNYDHYRPRDIPERSMIQFICDKRHLITYLPIFNPGKLRPSIHMVRWMSRIQRIITDVRLERLQDITEEDAIAEGVYTCHAGDGLRCNLALNGWEEVYFSNMGMAVSAFSELWNSIYAYKWDMNPWVWAIKFKEQ